MALCPSCSKEVKEKVALPFCSLRCRQVDLGRWLNEEYRVPTPDAEDAEQAMEGTEDE